MHESRRATAYFLQLEDYPDLVYRTSVVVNDCVNGH